MTLQEFYNKYNGQKNVGNTPENLGECVGLSSLWMDNFNIPHVYGNADDLYNNAPDEYFVKIPNTATAICQDGDIIVWGFNYNHSYGHTGVARGKHDVNNFECFEQNDPLGSTPHIKKYNYAYVIGWLRPKAYHGDVVEVVKPPLTGLAIDVGYNPTFEGQDVMVNGLHYKSIKDKNGTLIWKIETEIHNDPAPVITPVESNPTVTETPVTTSTGTVETITTSTQTSTQTPTVIVSPQKNTIPVTVANSNRSTSVLQSLFLYLWVWFSRSRKK